MSAATVDWNLGDLGTRTGTITPGAINAVEMLHGPIGGTFRRFAQGQTSFGEAVTIVFATVTAAEGKGAPTREQIEAAVLEVGIGEFTEPCAEVLRRVLSGVRPEGVPVQ